MSRGGGYLLSSRDGIQISATGLSGTVQTDGKLTHNAYSIIEYTVPPETNGPGADQHAPGPKDFADM